MGMRKAMREAICRGTSFDPAVGPYLPPQYESVVRATNENDVLHLRPNEEPSVLVSLAYHALHYVDLRILLVLRNLFAAGVHVTLVLRDHQAGGHAQQPLPAQEGRARLIDVLELLGVPCDAIRIVNWSEIANRLVNDADFHRYLSLVDTVALGRALDGDDVHVADFGDVLTTLTDVYLAGRRSYLPSAWLLGGPTRLEIHRRAAEAFQSAFGGTAPRSIPLPPLPLGTILPGILPDSSATSGVSRACAKLSRRELLLLHEAFFALLEDALGEPLQARSKSGQPAALDDLRLQRVTSDAIVESLSKLQAQTRKRRPADVMVLPPAMTLECLEALGDKRRASILETLLRAEGGLEVSELMGALGLPREQLSSVRRDLLRLKKVGLLLTRGVKPQRWVARARRLEIQLPRS